jgi:hypothetical protein
MCLQLVKVASELRKQDLKDHKMELGRKIKFEINTLERQMSLIIKKVDTIKATS